MADFVEVPCERVPPLTLEALLEEYASRDGTDYGLVEHSLQEIVLSLQAQLRSGKLALLYDAASEEWDILPRDQATELLQ